MKYFKHISDSVFDPFIASLVSEFGSLGYHIFFGTLEIYAREFKVGETWQLRVKTDYLRRAYGGIRAQTLKKVLLKINKDGNWDVNFSGNEIEIFIPKFRKLMDESTIRKLKKHEDKYAVSTETKRKKSVKSLKTTAIDKDKDKDKDLTTPAKKRRHFESKISKKYVDEINKHCEVLYRYSKFSKNGLKFNGHQWVQKCTNNNIHPLAIIDGLKGTIKKWHDRKDPMRNAYTYANGIIKTISGNYHEKDHVAESQEFKNVWDDISKSGKLKTLVSGIGG